MQDIGDFLTIIKGIILILSQCSYGGGWEGHRGWVGDGKAYKAKK